MKKVSIIVASYNVEKYIFQCIQSIINQTYSNIEIVIVDGSNDDTLKIIKEIKDSRIILIENQKEGLSSARNMGLKKATGDYVAFVDGDDYISKDYIYDMINNIKDSDLLICDYYEFYDNNYPKQIYHNEIERSGLTKREDYWKNDYHLTHELLEVTWNKLYKRDIFKTVSFPIGKYHEDEFVIHHIISKTKTISILNKKLYYYRHRNNSLMSTHSNQSILDQLESAFDRLNFYSNGNYFDIKAAVDYFFYSAYSISDKNILNSKEFVRIMRNTQNIYLSKIKQRYPFKKLDFLFKYGPVKTKKTYFLFLRYKNIVKKMMHIRECLYLYNLKIRLKNLKENDFLFLGSPTYGNIGDQAIAESMTNFCKNLKKRIIEIPAIYYQNVKHLIPLNIKNKIILIGGGNLGNLYKNEERFRREIISTYLYAEIIIFPQTLYFDNSEEGLFEQKISSIIYNNHKNLHLFLREKYSFDKAKVLFSSNDLNLCPDIVLSNKKKEKKNNKEFKVLIIARNDKERKDNKDMINLIEKYKLKNYFIGHFDTDAGNVTIYPWQRKKIINCTLKTISKYSLVITDRLHGMIFSYITNVPCVAYDNKTNKIKGTLELTNLNNVKFNNIDNEQKESLSYDNLKKILY